MDRSYSRVRAGGLKLKGGLKSSSSTKKYKHESRMDDPKATETTPQEDNDELVTSSGTGRLTSSGTTIHGYETKFMDEIAVGDAIIIKHPTTLADETRIVKMVLSNVSISISSPFSTDLVSTCEFRYISAPKEEETPEMKGARLRRIKAAQEDSAVGDYAGAGGTTLVYRKRKRGAIGGGNGYHIVREQLTEEKSRTELLEMRVKHKSDRHCS